MAEDDADIGVCIPVLNEHAVLGGLLDELRDTLGQSRYSICIVDDGSVDGTRELVRARASQDRRIFLLERTKTRPGCRRGGASRAGLGWLLANTTHAYFCDLDADGANRPSEILTLSAVARREAADVVIASKYVPGAVVTGRPLLRRFASRAYSGGLRVLLGGGIRDFSNSFRVYRREAAAKVMQANLAYDTPTYLIEMLAVWLSHGLRVVEVPTQYHERRTGASKVIPSDLLRGALGAVHVGMRYRFGTYR